MSQRREKKQKRVTSRSFACNGNSGRNFDKQKAWIQQEYYKVIETRGFRKREQLVFCEDIFVEINILLD